MSPLFAVSSILEAEGHVWLVLWGRLGRVWIFCSKLSNSAMSNTSFPVIFCQIRMNFDNNDSTASEFEPSENLETNLFFSQFHCLTTTSGHHAMNDIISV